MKELLKSLIGIIFLRRSPERLPHGRTQIRLALALAVIFAFAANLAFHELSIPFALLRIVCSLGVLVIAARQLFQRNDRRYRVLKALIALLLISALGDALLLMTSIIPATGDVLVARRFFALGVYCVQAYGAVNCVSYAMAVPWRQGLWYVLAYIAVVLVFYQATAAVLAAAMGSV